MADIRRWLEALDLGEYADAFESNDIEWDLLPDLTVADLRSLGIESAGHRVKLRAAIEDLASGEMPAPSAPAPETRGAERRQITIMFCDLVGSTALSEQMDPEELRAVMQIYQKTAASAVARYEGHVAQYLGDGLMAYFGWPQAHEDDAERAVRAGLDIVGAVKHVSGVQSALQVRIGIASGPVVVGESVTGDGTLPKLAVGETPNLAARIQGLAEPDQVVVGRSTHRLARHAFTFDDMGTHDLRGVDAPVQAWRVIGVAETEGRFEASRGTALAPLVGRDAELALLLQRWNQVKDGEGQVVLLSGEPGIGKSRIVRELRARVGADPHTWLYHQCSPFHVGTAFYPIIAQIERAAGIRRGDGAETARDKLDAMLAGQPGDGMRYAPLLAALLSIDADAPALNLSPALQKERTVEALVDLFVGLASEQPVLAIFEDAHWIDPTSLEALGEVISRIGDLPVLLIVTHRPEFSPPWQPVGHIAAQSLTRLSRRARTAMVADLTGGKTLPDAVRDQIVDKTDGVPLFIEELTKTVIEAGFLKDGDGRFHLDGPLPPLAIPPTLQDSLMARLDRLGVVKEIAQVSACIGREFSYDLLSAIAPLHGDALREALWELIDSELIHRRGTGDSAKYVFKHALVQDAAYASLLNKRRQQLHAAIAEAVMSGQAQAGDGRPEFLARHYAAAGMAEKAAPLFLAAGQAAMAKANTAEAIGHFDDGLREIAALPMGPERFAVELKTNTSMGYARIQQQGYAAPEAHAAFEKAEALLPNAGAIPQMFPVLVGIGLYHWVRGDMPSAVETFVRMRDMADASGDAEHDMLACTHLGSVYVNVGRLSEADALLERALALFGNEAPERQAELRRIYGQDIGVGLHTWRASGAAGVGIAARWRHHAAEGVERARSLDHPFSLIMGLSSAAHASCLARDTDNAVAWADEAIAIHRAQRMPFWGAWGLVARGVSQRLIGETDEAIANLSEAHDLVAGIGGTGGLSYMFAESALAHLDAGDVRTARGLIAQAVSALDLSKEEVWRAPIKTAAGEIAFAGGADADAAAAHFETAIATANAQGAHMFGLRAAMPLARYWGEAGDRQKALELLSPIYARFTDGFDGRDLTEAKQLMDALA